ncbi:MAG: hypothetical protein ABIZ50_01975 [Solirubrobacterales bacterium]
MEAATTAAPVAVPQHIRALEHANKVRLARAALKREVQAGTKPAESVVRACPWEAETMSVSELLRSQSRWGRTRTRKFLVPLAVSENRQLGRLTLRQREALAGALEDKQRHR